MHGSYDQSQGWSPTVHPGHQGVPGGWGSRWGAPNGPRVSVRIDVDCHAAEVWQVMKELASNFLGDAKET